MNKMFKKLVVGIATVAAVVSLSSLAFASESETTTPTTPSATHTDGSVSVNGYTVVEDATQYTVMVFENSFTGTETDKIYYINQGNNPTNLLLGMLVKSTTLSGGETTNNLPEGNYTVRIGNDKGSYVDVPLSVVETDEGIVVLWGDADGDGSFSSADAGAALKKGAGITEAPYNVKDVKDNSKSLDLSIGQKVTLTLGDETLIVYWGDADGDGSFSSADAGAALKKGAGITEAAYTVKDVNDNTKTLQISVGQEVKIKVYTEN